MHPIVRGGLALAVGIALAACGSSATPASNAPAVSSAASATAGATCAQATSAGTVQVEIKDFVFNPEPVQAKVGDTITWTNKDDAPHSAALDDGSCKTEGLNKDVAGSLTFSAAGTYPYHCAIHPTRMKGTIVVSG